MKTVLDIGIIKYTPNEKSEAQFHKLVDYFSKEDDDIEFNVLIHDNNTDNIGLIKARNLLLSQFHSDYVCFLDFDLDIKKVCWKDIIDKLENTDRLAIVSPVTERFSSVNKEIRWQPKEYLACNFMIFKRSVFDEIGIFDEDFFVAYGDWDMVKRCLDSKLLILQDNNSHVMHYGFSRENPDKSKIWRKDFGVFISKHKQSLDRSLK